MVALQLRPKNGTLESPHPSHLSPTDLKVGPQVQPDAALQKSQESNMNRTCSHQNWYMYCRTEIHISIINEQDWLKNKQNKAKNFAGA